MLPYLSTFDLNLSSSRVFLTVSSPSKLTKQKVLKKSKNLLCLVAIALQEVEQISLPKIVLSVRKKQRHVKNSHVCSSSWLWLANIFPAIWPWK